MIIVHGKSKKVDASTIILHSPHDKKIKFKYSHELLKNSDKYLDQKNKKLSEKISKALCEEGYHVKRERLISIGKTHGCTQAAPQDRQNKNPDSMFALQRSIEILLAIE